MALVRGRYNPFGGAERFVNTAVQALANEGLHLSVITRAWSGGGDADVVRCDPFYLGRLWRDAGFARCVCRTLATREYDLVQSHERIACCDIFRAGDGVHREWLRQRGRAANAWVRLGLAINPYHIYVQRAERRLFESPRLRAVICNSQMVRAEILREFAIAPEKCRVIYSGVDLEKFHPRVRAQAVGARERYGIPPAATVFLFLGSGFARKGLNACIEALAQLPADAHLLVVGKDKHESRYRALAQHAGIASRTHFMGGQAEPAPFYGMADAFILPTLYDPLPNAALEALACGLPVITSSKSGAAELIENGTHGFVCDALDVAGLVRAMSALLDADAARTMGAAARMVAQRLDARTMATQLIALYRELLHAPVDRASQDTHG